jgi:hypothetical protein
MEADMNIRELTPGTKLQLEDGSTAEVIEPSQDGMYVKIRYLESPFTPEVVGTEGLASDYEITGFTTDGSHTDTGKNLSF